MKARERERNKNLMLLLLSLNNKLRLVGTVSFVLKLVLTD
jgi:hypothetical protein